MRQGATKDQGPIAPSWSGLSTSKSALFRVSGVYFTLEITDVQMQPSIAAAPFGDVSSGRLTVPGRVKPPTLFDGEAAGCPSNGSQYCTGNSILWLKPGEDRSAAVAADQKVIFLELRWTTEHTWVRSRLSATSETGCLDTRIVLII